MERAVGTGERRGLALAASLALHLSALLLLMLWPEPPRAPQEREALTTIALPAPAPTMPPPAIAARIDARPPLQPPGRPGDDAAPASHLAAALPPSLPTKAPAAEPADGTSSSTGEGQVGRGVGVGGSGGGGGGGGGGTAVAAPDGKTPAVRTGGAIRNSDYPPGARKSGQHGRVETEIAVDERGRPSACLVTRTSGSAELDRATCRLILRRFRYAPARDAAGRAVASTASYDQQWIYRQADGR